MERGAQKIASDQAKAFIGGLLSIGVRHMRPYSGVQQVVVDAVRKALEEQRFSISMIGHIPSDGARKCTIEYLMADAKQGYHADGVHPRAYVELRNISDSPQKICLGATTKSTPWARRAGYSLISSATGMPFNAYYARRWANPAPGDVFAVPAGRAFSLLRRHSLIAWDEDRLKMPKPPAVVHSLEEVGGHLTVYAADTYEPTVISWRGPGAAALESKPARRSRAEE